MFGLSSASIDGHDDKNSAYKCDIVYGSINEFEADVLRDEYSKQGTRKNRQFEIVIVDEVDSMLIDGKNHMVQLTSTMSGMNELEPILAAIWIQVGAVASCVEEIEGVAYFNNNGVLFEIKKTKAAFIAEAVELHIRKLMRDEDYVSDEQNDANEEYPTMNVPCHLRDFVLKHQLKSWISSAIQAKYFYKNGRDYIIEKGEIKVVDRHNTGIIFKNMTFSNALHQFLQLKHGASVTSETMTTNFIANSTFFLRYKKNIYGLSGTLGSDAAQNFLKETYSVELIVVPPFRRKRYIQLAPIISSTNAEWRESIVSSALVKLQNNRACLIISESINEAKALEAIFVKKNEVLSDKKVEIFMYTTDADRDIIKRSFNAGQVIISTNLAGRGEL